MGTVYSSIPLPASATKVEDKLFAAWEKIQSAREVPFDADTADAWRDTVATLLQDVARALTLVVSDTSTSPDDLEQLADLAARVRDLSSDIHAIPWPKLSDLLSISDLLIIIEMDIARVRSRTNPQLTPIRAPRLGAARPARERRAREQSCAHPRPWKVDVGTGRVFRDTCPTCQD